MTVILTIAASLVVAKCLTVGCYRMMNFALFLVVYHFVQVELGRKQEVVVYDQSSKEAGHLSKDGFVHILMGKLEGTFHKVSLLTGM